MWKKPEALIVNKRIELFGNIHNHFYDVFQEQL